MINGAKFILRRFFMHKLYFSKPNGKMYYKKYFLILCLLNCLGKLNAQNKIYDTIAERIAIDLQWGVNDQELASRIDNNWSKLAADGSWIDINYNDAKFDPLVRIKEMAIAYVRPSNRFYHSQKVQLLLVKSLQNWADKNPKNKNWWYNDIFYPQNIGQILVLLQQNTKALPSELKAILISRMQRKMRENDGANTSDIALHYLYRACVTENKSTLDSATTYLYQPITLSNGKEGVQIDGSYYQHGKQQAIGSYGRVFLSNAVNATFYLRNTPYALPEKKLEILIDFFKNTFAKTIRGTYYDFNVRGRGISRKDSLRSGLESIINKMSTINAENNNYWNALALRVTNQKPAAYQIVSSHTFYWKSGYTLHVAPEYTFSVQTASTRTLRTERGNNENILGNFLADGATNIQRTGSEYANIMPVWEWDKIPGTTNRDYLADEGATVKKDWGIPGTTDFVGGLSDGKYGVSAYHLNSDSVEAKKAWFFFDKEIVCLGAGITSNTAQPIVTTINQSWLRSEVSVAMQNNSNVLLPNIQVAYKNATAVSHDSISYFFPLNQNLVVANQIQAGNWYRINNFQPKEERSGEVFKLWIDHGIKPTNAAYQYIVVPGSQKSSIFKNYPFNNLQILQNTPNLQVVMHKKLGLLQMVFYAPDSFVYNGMTIKVDKPCVLQINDFESANAILFIADPTQKSNEINLELKLPKYSTKFKLTCPLPDAEFAGKTVKFKLEKKNLQHKNN